MKKLFLVEFKNKAGEYEPLGIMTMADACEWSWNHGHAAIQLTHVREMSPAEA